MYGKIKMQTFLPYDDFVKTARCLDMRRLNKERVEAMQIINTLESDSRWRNHPAVLMWKNHIPALKLYCNTMIQEWISRGWKNTMKLYVIEEPIIYPSWFGLSLFHSCHRATLLFKNFNHYSMWGWEEEPKYEYFWPTKNGF